MLSKSALTGGVQNRSPPMEAFLGLNGGIFSGRVVELTGWGRKCIGGILGAENAIRGGKNRAQSFELADPGVAFCVYFLRLLNPELNTNPANPLT